MYSHHLYSRFLNLLFVYLSVTRGQWASLVAQMVKNSPAMQETQVRFLGWEDALHKEMTTPSSVLAWRIPWIEKPGGLQSMGCKELDTTEQLTLLPPGQCPHSHSCMSSAWLNSTELSNS